MANSKNLFAGLVKINGNLWNAYVSAKSEGKLIFANITTEGHVGKYIYANGVEYNVADGELFAALNASVADISAWKRSVEQWIVDTSALVPAINASVADLSTRMSNVESYSVNVSTRLNDISTYVHTEVDGSLGRLNSSVSTLETWRSEHADPSLNAFDASLKDHETRITTLETNAKDALESATISSAVASETATITLTTVDASKDNVTSSVSVTGDDYVKVGGSANAITLTTTVGTIETATADASGLATAYDVSVFVHNAISGIEGALVYRGTVASESDLNTAAALAHKGDVYVASTAFTGETYSADEGDMFIWNGTTWNRVERNLDQAVQATSATAFTDGNLIIGKGNHLVEGTNVALADVQTAMANANSAIQGVIANVSTANYVDASAAISSSTATITVGVKTQEVSTASTVGQGLADAKEVKDYVDAKTTDVKVQYSLNSSTSDYVKTSSEVDAAGRIISSSVGVVVITLADASNGSTGLADAEDVYTELTRVEEVMATAQTAMADTLGMEDNFSVKWTSGLGFDADDTYKDAIEKVAQKTATGVVTSFGGAVGAISVQGSNTNGDVSLWMDGSTLKAGVVGLNEVIAGAIDSSIKALDVTDASVSGQVVIAVPETDGKVAPERIQLKINGQNFTTSDGSMGAVIDGSQILVGGENVVYKDSSIAKAITDLSTAIDNISGDAIKSVVGETTISGNGTYVAVTATENPAGTVTLASELTLASNTYGSTAATGLATDAFIKDYLAWEVISD